MTDVATDATTRLEQAIERLIERANSLEVPDQYLANSTVCQMFDCSSVTRWRWVKTVGFPAPVDLGNGTLRTPLSELLAYARRRKAARDAKQREVADGQTRPCPRGDV